MVAENRGFGGMDNSSIPVIRRIGLTVAGGLHTSRRLVNRIVKRLFGHGTHATDVTCASVARVVV
jgi:hypothetical protein